MESRPQARRATQLAREAGLTDEHFAAIQATGISDAGKALIYQTGTGKNSERVKQLAAEAKALPGGLLPRIHFRPTRDRRVDRLRVRSRTVGGPGVVLDPFMGTGTRLADGSLELGRSAIGVDLDRRYATPPPSRIRKKVGWG